jgi:hypothetical protein
MARVVNNGMYGKDRSDLGAMVSLKGMDMIVYILNGVK